MGFRENGPQLSALQARLLAFPDEGRLIGTLIDWCRNTCPQLKSEIDTVSAKYSCFWRWEEGR